MKWLTALGIVVLVGPSIAQQALPDPCAGVSLSGLRPGMPYVVANKSFAPPPASRVTSRLDTITIASPFERHGQKGVIVASFARRDDWPLLEVSVTVQVTPPLGAAILQELTRRYGTPVQDRAPLVTISDRLAAFASIMAASADEARISRYDLLDVLAYAPSPLHSEWIVPNCSVRLEAFESTITSKQSVLPSGSVVTVSLSKQQRPPFPRFTDEDLAAARAFLGE